MMATIQPEIFATIAASDNTVDMVYFTPDVCGVLYPSSVADGPPVVLHGLRTEAVNWGMGAQHSAIRVHGGFNVQLNVSNSDWHTDCGRYCPTLMRHISDFGGQRVFVYTGHCATPLIISRMEQSAIVWRPLPFCQNSNCPNARVESEDEGSW